MLQIDLNVLRDHVKGKHTRARIGASGHGLYEDVEFRRAVGALVKNKYCVTLEVFMELTWDHIAVSVRWSGIILDEESIRE